LFCGRERERERYEKRERERREQEREIERKRERKILASFSRNSHPSVTEKNLAVAVAAAS
jgi:hypothetical protein